jgi:DNA-directed RNA polymerase I, II, and III subunit RPABC3
MELTLDINSDIYPMYENEKFTLALATSLDANSDPGHWNQHINSPLLDKYDYVMSGKVFKFVRETGSKL